MDIRSNLCGRAVVGELAAAQAAPPQRTQSNRGRVPDKPSTTSEAGKGKQQATIAGCVVRDAANGGEASIASNGISYRLTGKDEKELEQYLGKRVEVTGLLESGSTGARATSGKANVESSIPPKDQTATGRIAELLVGLWASLETVGPPTAGPHLRGGRL